MMTRPLSPARRVSAAWLAGALAACVLAQSPSTQPADRVPEAHSRYDGRPFYSLAPGARPQAEQELKAAQAAAASQPSSVEARIWVGRRLGYLWRMRDAIVAYTAALHDHPASAALHRHRGHRYISIRDFDAAIADLRAAVELIAGQADEIEPDGQPNKLNKPLTTLGFNVWYHLGLAHYLKGDYRAALAAYDECLKFSRQYADKLVATSYWMYLTQRRLGQDAEAARLLEAITPDMEIIENAAYHRLLMLFAGKRTLAETIASERQAATDAPTIAYGVAMWLHFNGEPAEANLKSAVSGDNWPAFGFIAAEAELARRNAPTKP
jgi:tetratricopeptide (TPR) repeat protein